LNTLVLAIVSVLLSVGGQFALKAGMSHAATRELLSAPIALQSILGILTNPYVLGGFVLYGLGAIAWLGVLAKWDVSKAYPVVGLGFGIAVFIGYLAGEQVTWLRVSGVAAVFLGIWLIANS